MKIRMFSAGIGILLLLVIVFANKIVLGIFVFIVAVIAITEFYNALKKAGYNPVYPIGYIGCIPVLFIALNGTLEFIDEYVMIFKSLNYFSIFIFGLFFLLMCFSVFLHKKYSLNDIALTLFGIIYIAFLMTFLILVRSKPDHGFYLMWFVFIGAWGTDTFAYFTGRLLGKHKIVPQISPNKTIEGSIGGFIGCIGLTAAYGMVMNSYGFLTGMSIVDYLIIGISCGILSQFGDWMASSLKRYLKIKDFGNIMPGHGGALDRFDSILFIAPFVYFYASFVLSI